MATPIIPTFLVNSSTSVVLVDSSQISEGSYALVYLSNVSYQGTVVTVRDSFGQASHTKQILVSTTEGLKFQDGAFSTLINQPFGFITCSSVPSASTWQILNTYAFANISEAAYVRNLTSDTVTTSTLQVLTKSFFSTIEVDGDALFHRNMDVSGTTTFTGPSLIKDNLTVNMSTFLNGIVTLSTFTTLSTFSTLGDAAIGRRFYVNEYTTLSSFSSIGDATIGRRLNVDQYTTLSSFSSIGDATIGRCLNVDQYTTLSSFSSIGDAAIGRCLTVKNYTTLSSFSTLGDGVITGALTVYSTISSLNTIVSGGYLFASSMGLGNNNIYIHDGYTLDVSGNIYTTGTISTLTLTLSSISASGGIESYGNITTTQTITATGSIKANGGITIPQGASLTGPGFNASVAISAAAAISTPSFSTVTISNPTTPTWVAVGSGTNKILYSTDTGSTWNPALGTTFGTNGRAVAFNGTLWVAVGESSGTNPNTILTSYDGIIWSNTNITGAFSSYGQAVAWNGTMWIAVGSGAFPVLMSTDGYTWTSAGITKDLLTIGYAVASNNVTTWVVTGLYGSNTFKTFYSSDNGVRWYELKFLSNAYTSLPGEYNGITYTGSTWILVGANMISILNTELSGASGVTVPTNTYIGRGVSFNGTTMVIVGNNGTLGDIRTPSINTANYITSLNDARVDAARGRSFSVRGNGVASGGTNWIAVGQDASGNTILKSNDGGTTWSVSGSFGSSGSPLTPGIGYGVAFGNVYSRSLTILGNTSITGIATITGIAKITGNLSVTGTILASGDITAFSDARLKTNVSTIGNALERLNQLRGIYYTPLNTPSTQKIGLLAQELEAQFPELVHTDASNEGLKSVAYGNITAVLIEGINTLTQRIRSLESTVSSLQG